MTKPKHILHLVNQSPFSKAAFTDCMQVIKDDDAILLFNDGVYAAINNTEYSEKLKTINICYAIREDIATRGINEEELLPHIQLINYKQFVDLSCEYPLSQSWY